MAWVLFTMSKGGVNIAKCLKIYNEKHLFNQKGFLNQSLIDYQLTTCGIMSKKVNAGLYNKCEMFKKILTTFKHTKGT